MLVWWLKVHGDTDMVAWVHRDAGVLAMVHGDAGIVAVMHWDARMVPGHLPFVASVMFEMDSVRSLALVLLPPRALVLRQQNHKPLVPRLFAPIADRILAYNF